MARVLIVDDESILAEMIAEVLHDDGHQTVIATSALDGLAQLQRWPADIVLVDMTMPTITGAQFCHAVRADPVLHTIPLILMSAGPDIPDRSAIGYSAYLRKPFELAELSATVAALLTPA